MTIAPKIRTDESLEILRRLEPVMSNMDKRFDTIEVRLDHMDERFDRMEEQLDKLDTQFERMDIRMGNVEGRVCTVEGRISQLPNLMQIAAVMTTINGATLAMALTLAKVTQHLF